ncbi:MAG: DUF1570 domain-containing protein [Planctomycetota bacterium]|nr:MAG: DUF1570 domain-containing protein [Planctomycetota bacterium]
MSLLLSLILIFAGPAFSAGPQEPAAASATKPDQAGFEDGLQQVLSWMNRGAWERAKKSLDELLEQHREQPYVFLRKSEVLEYAERCAFWSDRDALNLKDLVSGQLRTYQRANGSIHLRYNASNMEDFASQKLLSGEFIHFHPLTFDGPYSLEISGAAYPNVVVSSRTAKGLFLNSPTIIAGLRDDQGFGIIFGQEKIYASGVSGYYTMPSSLIRFDGENSHMLAQKEPSPAVPRKKFKLSVRVTAKDLHVYYNSKKILKTRKPDDIHGSIGFANIPLDDSLRIEIKGKAHTAWVQGLEEEAAREDRAIFLRTYRPEKVLPKWFTTQLDKESALEKRDALLEIDEPDLILPDESFPGRKEYLREADRLIEEGKYPDLLELVDHPQNIRVPETTQRYLKAIAYMALGRLQEAHDELEMVSLKKPQFLDAWRYRATLLASLRSPRAAIKELRELIQTHRKETKLYMDLVIQLLLANQPEEARQVLLDAAAKGLESKNLETATAILVKAEQGPNWGHAYSHRSRHYQIASNVNQDICEDAAKALEDALRGYDRYLLPLPLMQDEAFRVFIFAGQGTYVDYAAGVFGAAGSHQTVGMYSSLLKQLLIWNTPDPHLMRATVVHEGFHQYFDLVCPQSPTWLNEGMAVYFETAEYRSRQWKEGTLHQDMLKALDFLREKWLPLKELMQMQPAAFYGDQADLHYAQSWSLVWFLRRHPDAGELLQDFLKRLHQGEIRRDAQEAVFPESVIRELEPKWKAWLLEEVGPAPENEEKSKD